MILPKEGQRVNADEVFGVEAGTITIGLELFMLLVAARQIALAPCSENLPRLSN